MTPGPKQRFFAGVIEAWHGPLTAGQIVKRFRRSYATCFGGVFSDRRLRAIWQRARASGELPDAPRPFFVDATSACFPTPAPDFGALVDAAADRALMREIDRSERLSERGESLARAASDQSLAALRRAHRDLDDPALHRAPADWLKFDQRGVEPPSHVRLMQMARDYDAMTRARRSDPAPRLETCA